MFLSIFAVIVGLGALAVMDTIAKALIERLPVVEILAIRGWVTVALMVLWIPRSGGVASLKTDRKAGHLFRIIIGALAPVLFFMSLEHLPLANAYVVVFCSPFIMTILSVLIFRDRVGIHRWASVVVGFVGVTIALQPGTDAFNPAVFLTLGATLAYSGLMLGGRWLSDTEGTFKLVFFYYAGLTVLATVALPFFWQPVLLGDLALIAFMALLSIIGHVGLTYAFNTAPTAVVATLQYTSLVWAVFLGYVIWGDVPTVPVTVGAVTIVASGLYVIHREARVQKRPPPDDVTGAP